MIRPTPAVAISRRHSSRGMLCRALPMVTMAAMLPAWQPPLQGRTSLLGGPTGTGAVVLAEDPRRVGGSLSAALHAELNEQAGDVILDGLLRQEHPLADLPVGQPFTDQLQ